MHVWRILDGKVPVSGKGACSQGWFGGVYLGKDSEGATV